MFVKQSMQQIYSAWSKQKDLSNELTSGGLLLKFCHIPDLDTSHNNNLKFTLSGKIKLLREKGCSIGRVERGEGWRERTFSDESENPPTSNDPSWGIDEQLKLGSWAKA